MILVDVIVPAIDKKYDFRLNEAVPVSEVVDELAQIIGQKEHSSIMGEIRDFRLCDRKNQSILSDDITLGQAGIGHGDTLILV